MEKKDLFDLSGRVAIVTGGSRGLGKHFGLGLARAGADVVIADILATEAAETAKEIEKEGRASLAVRVDVTREEDVQKMAHRVKEHFGKIDILVNNAGINVISPAEDFPEDQWNKVVDVNLKGVFLCAKAVGKIMIGQKCGKIVSMASIHGLVGSVHNAIAYNSTKAAVINLTRSLAVEWGKYSINVNAIAPGIILTELTRNRLENKEYHDLWVGKTPLGRIGRPEDLLGALIYLASDASNWVSGHTVVVDGGYTAL
jgi:2-deoxy-D-gluconate 3-dehydrogenase